jgi:hypothetical protein
LLRDPSVLPISCDLKKGLMGEEIQNSRIGRIGPIGLILR